MEKTISRICENCQKTFYVIPSRIKHGRGKHCSSTCQYEAIKRRVGARVERKCIGCGTTFLIQRSKVLAHKGAGKYCSRKCRDENRAGKNHPQFMNGISQEKRGNNWQSQKRKALKRDNYTCQFCGEVGTDVHHVIPFRLFGLDKYKDANKLSNLLTLCRTCHRKADSDFQKEERNQ